MEYSTKTKTLKTLKTLKTILVIAFLAWALWITGHDDYADELERESQSCWHKNPNGTESCF
jgi:hypothetical protein